MSLVHCDHLPYPFCLVKYGANLRRLAADGKSPWSLAGSYELPVRAGAQAKFGGSPVARHRSSARCFPACQRDGAATPPLPAGDHAAGNPTADKWD